MVCAGVPEPESLDEDRFIKGLNEGPLKAVDFFWVLAAGTGSGAMNVGVLVCLTVGCCCTWG